MHSSLVTSSFNKKDVPVSDAKVQEFANFIDEQNVDFKENIMKNVMTLKLFDTNDLIQRVEVAKKDEDG